VGDDDELNAVACAKLGEDRRDVGLYRQRAEVEGVCDLAVVASVRDESEYFEFAWAELVESFRYGGGVVLGLGELGLDQAASGVHLRLSAC
jgi:hypothetical protein